MTMISEQHEIVRLRELSSISLESNLEVRQLVKEFRDKAESFLQAHGGKDKLSPKQKESVDFLLTSANTMENAIINFDKVTCHYEGRFLQIGEFVRKAKVLQKIGELEQQVKDGLRETFNKTNHADKS
ncbi:MULTISPECIES: hypothetical protein [unclassified Arcicella]|uniref:hypothetical protein n=1 Tax=unclassified Arcicella TaxID=2644986 RepID=UPI00285C2D6E|nr:MULTISPECIES: hypothetical protein [unclassified Arcicella]MDR6564929.1 hypothetical protein [Arcicella sp. BE51]MDR6814719.1 hypothetical protein [Arcicella sp. BE140]MDR6826165.1 hypothetical protein [Arcicella sp. BE139]